MRRAAALLSIAAAVAGGDAPSSLCNGAGLADALPAYHAAMCGSNNARANTDSKVQDNGLLKEVAQGVMSRPEAVTDLKRLRQAEGYGALGRRVHPSAAPRKTRVCTRTGFDTACRACCSCLRSEGGTVWGCAYCERGSRARYGYGWTIEGESYQDGGLPRCVRCLNALGEQVRDLHRDVRRDLRRKARRLTRVRAAGDIALLHGVSPVLIGQLPYRPARARRGDVDRARRQRRGTQHAPCTKHHAPCAARSRALPRAAGACAHERARPPDRRGEVAAARDRRDRAIPPSDDPAAPVRSAERHSERHSVARSDARPSSLQRTPPEELLVGTTSTYDRTCDRP